MEQISPPREAITVALDNKGTQKTVLQTQSHRAPEKEKPGYRSIVRSVAAKMVTAYLGNQHHYIDKREGIQAFFDALHHSTDHIGIHISRIGITTSVALRAYSQDPLMVYTQLQSGPGSFALPPGERPAHGAFGLLEGAPSPLLHLGRPAGDAVDLERPEDLAPPRPLEDRLGP